VAEHGPAASSPTIEDVRRSALTLRGVVRETPLLPAEGLSRRTGYQVYLKAENLQRTGAFKLRGAYAKIAALPADERARGVVTASAGNHGQGVALAAQLLGAPATIVLPENAALTKVTAIQARGARTVLHGTSYEAAYAHARELARSEGCAFVHPYDDWQVIAGQGTVALEILDARPEVGAILVPVGGGGLIAGVALATKALAPAVSILGVQAARARGAVDSFAAGRRVTRPAETIADGIKVTGPGEKTFAVIRRRVDRMLAVEEEEIYRAVVYLLENTRLVVEPAGAVGVAALLAGKVALPAGTSVVAILSGGNVDPNLLHHLIEYGLAHSGRSLLVRVRLPDRPGQLVKLLQPLAERRVNILNIEHRRATWGLPVDVSEVLLHLETRGPEHCAEVLAALEALGFDVEPIPAG
jgi:threonine dehydratase